MVTGHGITHQVKSPFALLDLPQHRLSLRYRAALKPADGIVGHTGDFRKFHGVAALLGTQGAAGRSHTYPFQGTVQFFLHAVCHPARYLGHLGDVLNLAIQHGALAMFFLFNR